MSNLAHKVSAEEAANEGWSWEAGMQSSSEVQLRDTTFEHCGCVRLSRVVNGVLLPH